MSTRAWTPEQTHAIRTTGMGLLVSAAAGSGKTSVLSERCAHLVCAADDRCHVNQLLVVTFTEAAAAEMKTRIEQAIRTRASGSVDPHLLRQLKLVEHAQVSTLHSFCQRLLRRHFHKLDLDPNFVILDADEALLLRDDVVRCLFADRYESADPAFQAFIDAYGTGQDDQLMRQIISTHELLGSLVQPEQWLARARAQIAQAVELPLEQSDLGKVFLATIQQRLRGIIDEAAAAVGEMPTGCEKYVDYLHTLGGIAENWLTTLESRGYDAMAEAVDGMDKFPRLPSVRGEEAAKALVQRVQGMLKDDTLRQNLRYSSDDWRKTMAATLPHADVFLSLVEAFGEQYRQAKRASRGIDFSDLERMALDLLCEDRATLRPSDVARSCHRAYRHVLVDEYQDINEVQDAILHLTSTECLAGQCVSNLFCVGDVKQSIYRFRLAEPMRFLDRETRYRDADEADAVCVIDLTSNFRSRGPLLEAINAVFERLMSAEAAEIEYDARHRLSPGVIYPDPNPTAFTGAPIELHLLPTPPRAGSTAQADETDGDPFEADDLDRTDREALLVVRRIRELMGQTGSPRRTIAERQGNAFVERPIEYGDIVLLLRSLKNKADQFAATLRGYGIPVHADGGAGFFQAVEVRDMLALLSILDNQQQDLPLAVVLRSPIALTPHPDDALARIRLAYNDPEQSVPFHQAVVRYAQEQDDDLAAHLRDFLARLGRWRDAAMKRPLAEVIWSIYDETGYLAYTAGLEDGEQRQANLLHLHERARQFGGFQRQGLYRFLQFLDNLREQTELGQASLASQADNVVRIMSIHGSKGLEFPVVIVPDLGKRMNLDDTRGRILVDRSAYLGMQVIDDDRYVCYPSLGQVVVQDRMQRTARAEELRLLYVAMTRAREHLVLIGTCGDKQYDGWQQRWAGHPGQFPADLVLGANCMLDWIGPAAVASTDANAIEFHLLDEGDIESLKAMSRSAHPDRPGRADLAALKPLSPPPPADQKATDVIQRVTYRYPYADRCARPARLSVTALTQEQSESGLPDLTAELSAQQARLANRNSEISDLKSDISNSKSEISNFKSEISTLASTPALSLPRCISADVPLAATDRGTAAHTLLQHLDFTRVADESAIRQQIDHLVHRRLLTAEQAETINIDDILWLTTASELAPLFTATDARLIREMPFYLALDHPNCPPANDPMDRLMVRGRIDLVIAQPDGLSIIDYKTDRVTRATIAQRARDYRDQITLYRQAIQNAANHPVKSTALAFLHARQVIRV